MKKRTLMLSALTLFAATASVSLTSCGGQDPAHTITFYHTMGDSLQKVLATAVEDFEAKYPGWKIQAQQVGGYDDVKDAITADLRAEQQPDVAYCYADHVASYLGSGMVLDLSNYIKNQDKLVVNVLNENNEYAQKEYDSIVGYTEAEVADFVAGYYAEGYATNYADYEASGFTADSILTLPFVKSTEVLYYNKSALDDCKLQVPTTWDELWACCKKIKQKYPNSTPLGYDSEANWAITMCEQNGWGYTSASGDHYLFNNDGLKGWFEDLNEHYEDDEYFTTQSIYGSYTSNLFIKGATEGSIFSIGSSGGASHQATNEFTWGVAPIPGSVLPNGEVSHKVISQGPSLVMFKSNQANAEEKQLMTWTFVKMLEEPLFQCSFAISSGYNPVRETSYTVSDYVRFLDGDSIVAKTAVVGRDQMPYYFTSPAFVGSSTARKQIGSALVFAATGEKSAEEALVDALAKCGVRS